MLNPCFTCSNKPKKAIIDNLYRRADVKSSAMELAEEVQAYLAADTPSFVKFMLPSHVTRGFWLVHPKLCLRFMLYNFFSAILICMCFAS